VRRMYQLGCHSYMVKPVNFGVFLAAIEKLASYWFDLVILPGCATKSGA